MKIKCLFLILALLMVSCDRNEDPEPVSQSEPLLTKMSVKVLYPGALPYDEAEMAFNFSYSADQKLTERIGGLLPAAGSADYNSGYFTQLIQTSLVYNSNKVTVENVSASPHFSIQKNTRYFTLNAESQIVQKEIPSVNPYLVKKEIYTYKEGKLDRIETTYPNMPYDPTDPDDHIFTESERFYYDASENLIKTEYVELQDGEPTLYKRVRTFENYDRSYNPFRRLILLDEYFYRSLSKNNFRTYNEVVTHGGTISNSQQQWIFNYDTNGNIIIN